MNQYIEYANHRICYTVVRSKRKTIGISVCLDKGVRILAPYRATEQQLREVVEKKASWILNSIRKLEHVKEEVPERTFVNGDILFLLGMKYILKIERKIDARSISVQCKDSNMIVTIPYHIFEEEQKEAVKQALIHWYREQARDIVNERIAMYSQKMGVQPAKIVIKQQKTRWGSCSTKKNININWRIIMAPIQVVDYVIVHELAHLKEMNHSTRFWSLVGNVMPDYKEYRDWLKENGIRLKL